MSARAGRVADETTRRLVGTVAVVTGASSGIGNATARRLAAEGAAVALVARRGEILEGLAAEITAAGGTASAIEADITSRPEATAAMERTVDELGRIDIVVNNAGVMLLGPVEDAPVEEWDRMVNVNLLAVLHCTRAALPHLLAAAESEPRHVADIVNVSSIAGRGTRAGSAVYNLTKWGLGGFSGALRQELGAKSVRVLLVEPGAVNTELTSHLRSPIRENEEEARKHIEPLEADDVADAIVYCVTRRAGVAMSELMVVPTK